MAKYFLALFLFLASSSQAFEASNVQLMYSNSFDGNSFVYDTQDGKKTTFTFEHFRTFSYGDFFMFVDVADGKKFNNRDTDIYAEFGPRLSFSKILDKDLSFGIVKDIFIATQLEKAFDQGDHYRAYLIGLGANFEVPFFPVFSVNVYNKNDNIHNEHTYQITAAYTSQEFFGIHLTGFIDQTKRDFSTQNQVLLNLGSLVNSQEKLYVGIEWLYYNFSANGRTEKTSAVQAMLKYSF